MNKRICQVYPSKRHPKGARQSLTRHALRSAFFFVFSSFFFLFLFFRGDFRPGRGSNGTDKQYHRPDLNERYKTRVMRPAMREGIVDQRLARLQGRGSERERTESHRHHPAPTLFRSSTTPPFFQTNPRSTPLLLLLPPCLPFSHPVLSPFVSAPLYSPCRVPFSRHSYLAIFETQPWVSLSYVCLRVLVVSFSAGTCIRISTRLPFCTLVTSVSVCRVYVRVRTCISSIRRYTYVKCQSERIRRRAEATSMSEHNTGCGIQTVLLFYPTEV